jgi:hypothetical protein
MPSLETGYHDATMCSFDGSEVLVAWCKVDGLYVDTEECDTEDEARRWCEDQERARG